MAVIEVFVGYLVGEKQDQGQSFQRGHGRLHRGGDGTTPRDRGEVSKPGNLGSIPGCWQGMSKSTDTGKSTACSCNRKNVLECSKELNKRSGKMNLQTNS